MFVIKKDLSDITKELPQVFMGIHDSSFFMILLML